MARVTREAIIAEKEFYPRNFRRIVRFLLFSLVVNFSLFAAVAYVKLNQSLPSAYATNNAGLIEPLMRVAGPNTSSQALLKPSPKSDAAEKKLEGIT